jgi:peptide/nickel transport system substrate-binding protein
VKAPPDQGGWNLFITWADGNAVSNPIALAGHAATGEKAWFGWPSDAKNEELRDKWALAGSLAEKQQIARELQENAWNFVPHVWLGQWVAPTARRKNLTGILAVPAWCRSGMCKRHEPPARARRRAPEAWQRAPPARASRQA